MTIAELLRRGANRRDLDDMGDEELIEALLENDRDTLEGEKHSRLADIIVEIYKEGQKGYIGYSHKELVDEVWNRMQEEQE